MPRTPELIEDDVRKFRAALTELIEKSGACAAFIAAEGGFLLCEAGDFNDMDVSTLGALSANAFAASQAIAGMLGEPGFKSIYQQGEQRRSLLVSDLDGGHLLVVLFPREVSVGVVKYYAAPAGDQIRRALKAAADRAQGQTLDLALLNVTNLSDVFRRKGQ